jgi:hypothetical protein
MLINLGKLLYAPVSMVCARFLSMEPLFASCPNSAVSANLRNTNQGNMCLSLESSGGNQFTKAPNPSCPLSPLEGTGLPGVFVVLGGYLGAKIHGIILKSAIPTRDYWCCSCYIITTTTLTRHVGMWR